MRKTIEQETQTEKHNAGKQGNQCVQKPTEKNNEECSEPTNTQKIIRRINVIGKVHESSGETDQNEKSTALRPKIVLMQSDDDDDEDFINIKADAEAGKHTFTGHF